MPMISEHLRGKKEGGIVIKSVRRRRRRVCPRGGHLKLLQTSLIV